MMWDVIRVSLRVNSLDNCADVILEKSESHEAEGCLVDRELLVRLRESRFLDGREQAQRDSPFLLPI